MPRYLQLLIGPEFFWLLLFGIISLLVKVYAPSKSFDNFIEYFYMYVPLVSLLVFALWYIPGIEKNWLLLRVWIAGILGGHYVLEKGLEAYTNQGPGVGMGWLAGMMFLFVFLVVGSVFVVIKF